VERTSKHQIKKEITRIQASKIAGIGLLLMAVFTIFATSNTVNLTNENIPNDSNFKISVESFTDFINKKSAIFDTSPLYLYEKHFT
jgi:hypothetical protein